MDRSSSTNTKTRPRFLQVLCILTFVSSLSGLWARCEQMWAPGTAAEAFKVQLDQQRGLFELAGTNQAAYQQIMDEVIDSLTPETIVKLSVIMIIYECLCLFGAFYMWNMKKIGFYLYLGAVVVALFLPFIVVGGMASIGMTIGSALISGLMAFLYSFNIKYFD